MRALPPLSSTHLLLSGCIVSTLPEPKDGPHCSWCVLHPSLQPPTPPTGHLPRRNVECFPRHLLRSHAATVRAHSTRPRGPSSPRRAPLRFGVGTGWRADRYEKSLPAGRWGLLMIGIGFMLYGINELVHTGGNLSYLIAVLILRYLRHSPPLRGTQAHICPRPKPHLPTTQATSA